jgi:UDP-N-acetylglucosamine 2-epimerase (non-hydrolysing)
LVTDSITNYFFTTSEVANNNLLKSGIEKERIFFVGNTMIDTLLKNVGRLQKPAIWNELNLKQGEYLMMTLHRPGNVDEESKLKETIVTIAENANNLPLIFPIHPRTAKILGNQLSDLKNLHLIEPLGYLEFNYLVKNCKAVITDSGGITEETTVMQIPCMTLRNSTERPETCTVGTNELVGTNPKALKPYMEKLLKGEWKKGGIPMYWDGKTSERIVEALLKIFSVKK